MLLLKAGGSYTTHLSGKENNIAVAAWRGRERTKRW
jgi:hypothetical protein